ncbi:hypothetical protein Alg130_11256 [Pyrenophora tritici-repentis]|nr:hypothetical protein Alg130_11256 [Pyrenophora tritici-repentis]
MSSEPGEASLPADPAARLKDVPDNAEDITRERTGSSQARDAFLTHAEEVELRWHMVAETPTSNHTIQSEHYLNDGGGDNQPILMCNYETEGVDKSGDGPSGGAWKKDEEDKESCSELLGGGLLGSKENPVVLKYSDDDGEPKPQLSHYSTGSVSDHGGSNSDDGFPGCSSGRQTRQKRERVCDGFELWGRYGFLSQSLAECQTHWGQVCVHWLHVKAALSKLCKQDWRLQHSLDQFYASFSSLSAAPEAGASVSASVCGVQVLKAISLWQKIKEELETGGAAMSKEEQEVTAKFEQAMDVFSDAAVLYDSIKQYSSSVESKDEQRDGDYKGTRHQRKIQRRR